VPPLLLKAGDDADVLAAAPAPAAAFIAAAVEGALAEGLQRPLVGVHIVVILTDPAGPWHVGKDCANAPLTAPSESHPAKTRRVIFLFIILILAYQVVVNRGIITLPCKNSANIF
jgi:hypothetical protein